MSRSTAISAGIGLSLLSGCGPIPYYYDADARKSFSEPGEGRVAKVVYSPLSDSNTDALNAARRFCGLPAVDKKGFEMAAQEVNWELNEPGLLNSYAQFECPEPGKEIQ